MKVNKNILCVSAVFKLREIFRPFLPLAPAQAAVAAVTVIVAAATVAFVVWKFQHLFLCALSGALYVLLAMPTAN